MKKMTPYYKGQLEDAEIYQDWLMKYLNGQGVILQVFTSKEYQFKYGESISHDEIKFDKEQENTGNLAIETYEKTNPTNPDYVPSGVLRPNIVRWISGNYNNIWIFSARELKKYIFEGISRPNDPLRCYQTDTSKGILLPCIEADKIVLQKFRPHDEDLIKPDPIIRPEIPLLDLSQPRKEMELSNFGVS